MCSVCFGFFSGLLPNLEELLIAANIQSITHTIRYDINAATYCNLVINVDITNIISRKDYIIILYDSNKCYLFESKQPSDNNNMIDKELQAVAVILESVSLNGLNITYFHDTISLLSKYFKIVIVNNTRSTTHNTIEY